MTRTTLRRSVLIALCLLLALGVGQVFAGGQGEKSTSSEAVAEGAAGGEAPMLAELVARGELPPVEERLPSEPLVIEPVERVGKYGGSIEYFAINNRPGNAAALFGYDQALRFSIDATEIKPNVFKDVEITNGGRTFVMSMREGMKWSDGEPFTSDDVAFWWNDIVGNEDLTTVFPKLWTVNGEPATFKVIDDYTVQFDFVAPKGQLLEALCSLINGHIYAPKHYLSQFHADYADEAELNAQIDEEGVEEWNQLFGGKNDYYTYANPDLPVLKPWVLKTPPPATRYTLERNPYYYKVDTAGNQLPYIDTFYTTIGTDPEVVNLNVTTGKADLAFHGLSLSNYTLYKENEEQGGYTVYRWMQDAGSHIILFPNQTSADEVMRSLNQDIRFRQALSFAINRDRINELVYLGLGEPRADTLFEDSAFYRQGSGWADMHVGYDLDRANELLDEIGLEWDSDRRFRLRPDGKTLSILAEGPSGVEVFLNDIFAIIKQDYEEIGIQFDWNITDRSNYRNRIRAGEVQMGTWSILTEATYPFALHIVPVRDLTYYASSWGQWYATDGQGGMEPPATIKRMQDLYDQVKATADQDEQKRLIQELYDIYTTNLYGIGIVGKVPDLFTMKSNMRNVPEEGISSWNVGHYLGHKQIVQFFYE